MAPYRPAARPKSSAPKNATNCTSRIVAIRTDLAEAELLAPYVDEDAITVWMPSLKNR